MVSGNVRVVAPHLYRSLSCVQEDWTAEQLEDIKKLIGDKTIVKTAETRHAELQLLESTKYHGACLSLIIAYLSQVPV